MDPLTAGHDPRNRWVVRFAVVNLVLQVLIIVTGGIVRLTASGLGCPTWPECTDGSLVPTADQIEGVGKIIEFGNRLLTFVVAAGAIAVLVAVLRFRRSLWPLGLIPLVGTVAQAVLGGITVLTRLHPATVMGHFLISALLVAASTWLLWRAREPRAPVVAWAPTRVRRLAWAVALLGAVVVVLGTVVTGTGPHSGDADEPVRFALDFEAVSRAHGWSAIAVTLLLGVHLVTALRLQAGRRVLRWATVVAALVVAQGIVGYVQYFTGLPRPLVSLHMLLAALFSAGLVTLVLSTRTRGVGGPGRGRLVDGDRDDTLTTAAAPASAHPGQTPAQTTGSTT